MQGGQGSAAKQRSQPSSRQRARSNERAVASLTQVGQVPPQRSVPGTEVAQAPAAPTVQLFAWATARP
jgi:hypothetical protein